MHLPDYDPVHRAAGRGSGAEVESETGGGLAACSERYRTSDGQRCYRDSIDIECRAAFSGKCRGDDRSL